MYFFLIFTFNFFLQCPVTPVEIELFHVGDDVNILEPYDGIIARTKRIQSLTKIHGVTIEDTDANIVVLYVSSIILVAYEDPMDGCQCLKETEMSFIWWPKIYLKKLT